MRSRQVNGNSNRGYPLLKSPNTSFYRSKNRIFSKTRVTVNEASSGVQRAWLSTGPESELRAAGFYLHLGWYKDDYLDEGQVVFMFSERH